MNVGRNFKLLAGSFLILLATSCGGGGGGGGGDGETNPGRSTETGLRILHGSLDTSPVFVSVGEDFTQTARFNQARFPSRVDEGAQTIIVSRENRPTDILTSFSITFEEKTEYSLLITGRSKDDSLRFIPIPEPIVQPEPGLANIQLINSYEGSSSVTLTGSGFSIGPLSRGEASGYIEIASGPQTVTVRDLVGDLVGTLVLDVKDRGEVTILASGDKILGVSFLQTFLDED